MPSSDHPGDHGPAPHHRLFFLLHEEVDRHYANTAFGFGGDHAVFITDDGPGMEAKGLGDGGPCDVGIHNADTIAASLHGDGQHRSDRGFADPPFPADDGNDLFDSATGIWRGQKRGLIRRGALL